MHARHSFSISVILVLSLAAAWLSACGGPATPKAGLANPASVFCAEHGGRLTITTGAGGQAGMCVFADGSQCDEWAFYRGECAPGASKAAAAGPAPLTEAMLKNAKYELPDIKTVQLADGKFELKVGEGASQVNRVELTRAALGDLNGDGAGDGAAVLAANTGGSGTFVYLLAVLNRGGAPVQVGVELLGDRVNVQSLAIKDGQVVLNMLGFGPTDPKCCPSQSATRAYRLQGDKLQLVSEVKP